MVFPILGGNSVTAGYSIDNSLRFNDGDSPYLAQTPSASNRRTFSISFWVKRGILGTNATVFAQGSASNNQTKCRFVDSDSSLFFDDEAGGTSQARLITNKLFRDVSAWYHILIAVDTTQGTSSDRIKLYVNGVQETSFATSNYPSQNHEMLINTANAFYVGRERGGGYFDGYLAEFHFIDGTAKSPTDFGEFDEDSGIWKPIEYTGSYGTNGFYLDFEGSGGLYEQDKSGNGNDFVAVNLLQAVDVTTDTPTNNFATLNPLSDLNCTFSEGNVEVIRASDAAASCVSTIAPTSGKWYYEFQLSAGSNVAIGVAGLDDWQSGTDLNDYANKAAVMLIEASYNASIGYVASSSSATTLQNSTNLNTAKYGMAVDLDNGNMYASANGSWYSSVSGAFDKANFSDATTIVTDIPTGEPMAMAFRIAQSTAYINFGNAGGDDTISSGNSDGNGYGNFEYSVPSGYLALCTQNLATALSPTIDDGSAYFHTQLYAGNGSTQSITNDAYSGDFKPDWLWIKERQGTSSHFLFDSNRGVGKYLHTNSTSLEGNDVHQTSFDTDGFSVGQQNGTNENNNTYAAWQWKVNGGTTSSNTDGSITSTVQANTTAGFSIVTWTGNATASATVGHGLGVAPEVVIIKNRSDNESWWVGHQGAGSIGDGKYLFLNSNNAVDTNNTSFCNANPTTTTFKAGGSTTADNAINGSGDNMLAYCFAPIEGYSKFGSYEGNAVADGTFVYTGFKPAWIMIKRYSGSGHDWIIIDTKRFTFNVIEDYLKANSSDAEIDTFSIDEDILSNGFKLRGTSTNINGGGSSYIYMAFAENPFVTSSGVPVTAR